jgi:hypothetical protein
MRNNLPKLGRRSCTSRRQTGGAHRRGSAGDAARRPPDSQDNAGATNAGAENSAPEILAERTEPPEQPAMAAPTTGAPGGPLASATAGIVTPVPAEATRGFGTSGHPAASGALLAGPDSASPRPYPLSVLGSTVPARQKAVMESPVLLAFHNGRKIIGTLVKMWRLFWACHYGWLLPVDWYHWAIEGHESSEYVCLKATALPRRFGLVMHMRGKRFLTLGDWEQLEKAVGLVSDDVFHQMGSRFSRIFWFDRPEHLVLPLSLRPFFHYRIEETGDRGQPAYRMHPERTWLLVLGVAPGQDITDNDIDWSVFQTPPPPDVPDEEIDWTMFLTRPSWADDIAKHTP